MKREGLIEGLVFSYKAQVVVLKNMVQAKEKVETSSSPPLLGREGIVIIFQALYFLIP